MQCHCANYNIAPPFSLLLKRSAATSFDYETGAKNGDFGCVFHPAPSGSGCKTRLESRIKRFNLDLFMIAKFIYMIAGLFMIASVHAWGIAHINLAAARVCCSTWGGGTLPRTLHRLGLSAPSFSIWRISLSSV